MNKTDFLARVSLFSTMDPKDLEGLAERCGNVRFQAGDMVIMEGDRDRRLFVIVTGAVDVIKGLGTKSERHVRSLGPLDYFGEMSLIDDMVRSASVRAAEETELLSLDHETFVEGIGENPRLALELLKMMSHRIRAIEHSMMTTLGSVLPICASCKNILQSGDEWVPITKYISDRSEAEFTHKLCPRCKAEAQADFERFCGRRDGDA